MTEITAKRPKDRPNPAQIKKRKGQHGKEKLASAMRKLLETKEFQAITTDEIAKTASTNEALIYRYFGDKRGLLHKVLADYLYEMQNRIDEDLKGVNGALKKLAIIIRDTFEAYSQQKVFARILLVEVRNFPRYFESKSYHLVKVYSQLIVDTIEEGISAEEIRSDVSPRAIRDILVGSIEHTMLPFVLFGRDAEADTLTQKLYKIVISGIMKKKSSKLIEKILAETLTND